MQTFNFWPDEILFHEFNVFLSIFVYLNKLQWKSKCVIDFSINIENIRAQTQTPEKEIFFTYIERGERRNEGIKLQT